MQLRHALLSGTVSVFARRLLLLFAGALLPRRLRPAPARPEGKSVGRRKTVDAARAKADKLPSPEEQHKDWLRRSCLTNEDLPGKLHGAERTIEFFDIDRKKLDYVICRFFVPDSGWTPGVEPLDKYKGPRDEPPRLYYPQNYKGDWRAWAQDPTKRKLFVEGQAKAACATKFGFPAVGIQGCYGWSDKKRGHPLLLDFDEYNFEGCDVYWVPDRDRKPQAVNDVFQASEAFAFLLKERGAKVHVVELEFLDDGGKVGVDDFFFHFNEKVNRKAAREAFEKLLADAGEWAGYDLTDPGNVSRWVKLCGHRFRHVGKRWLEYLAGCWRDDGKSRHALTVREMFQDMVDNARRSANTEWLKHLRSHVTRTRIDNVVALARADSVIAASPDEFDRYTLWVNCLNLVLEMPVDGKEPLRFHDHRPEDMLTRQAAVKYVPGAKCPVFLKALNFWTGGDKELQRTIQQLLGLSITGVTRQQSFFILHGEGNTGKSTLLETVTTILGSYAKAVPSDVFLKQRNGTPEERKMAMLPGVRFATCSETPANGQLDENLLKRMTGEDTMSYRRLYEEQSDFKPEFKAWLRTNNLPQISGTGNDIWRRVIPIPFGRVVPEALKDLDLKDKLKQELEGIFAWMVEGYLDYAKNGLVKAAVVEQDAQTYRKEQDLIEQFLEATCEFDSSYNVGKEELFFAYKSWCDSRGRRPLDVKVFKKELLSERFKGRHIELKEMGPKGHRVEKWKGLDLSTKLFEKKHAPKPE